MKRPVRRFGLLVLLAALALGAAALLRARASGSRIAFLKGGEVWLADGNAGQKRQVTRTGGRVKKFLVSPKYRYLAYSKVRATAGGSRPGRWGAAIGEEGSVAIVNLANGKLLEEIAASKNAMIYPTVWMTAEKLLLSEAYPFVVARLWQYDIGDKSRREIEGNLGSRLRNADYFDGGHLYVDFTGLGRGVRCYLHLVDTGSDSDRIILTMQRIQEPRMSPDRRSIAFYEVEPVAGKYFDNVWIFTIEDGSLSKLYRGPAGAKTAGLKNLQWSPDGRYLGVFVTPKGLVLKVDDPSDAHEITGIRFQWLSNDAVVFDAGEGIHVYNLATRSEKVLVKNASGVQVLGR